MWGAVLSAFIEWLNKADWLWVLEKIWTIVLVPFFAIFAFIWQWKDRKKKADGKPLIAEIRKVSLANTKPLNGWTAVHIFFKNERSDTLIVKRVSVPRRSDVILARANQSCDSESVAPEAFKSSRSLKVSWIVRPDLYPLKKQMFSAQTKLLVGSKKGDAESKEIEVTFMYYSTQDKRNKMQISATSEPINITKIVTNKNN